MTADYAMSSVPGYTTQQVIAALTLMPMMLIVTTNADMFGPQGIYANPDDRNNLNVPGSLEYFDPNNPSVNYSAGGDPDVRRRRARPPILETRHRDRLRQ